MAVALPYTNKIETDSTSVEPDIIRIKFGGGYTQRIARGYNNMKETIDITWINLDRTEMRNLKTTLEANRGLNLFAYTPSDSTVQKYWTVLTVNSGDWRRASEGDRWNVRAQLERAWDPNP